MRFLPIIERELRVAGRKPRTYWGRVGSVAVLAVIVFWVLLASVNQSPATIGQTLFYVLGGLTAFTCAFAGLRLTSDCLSVEKREGTLGLLFLTDLRGVDIAMGKLGAATIQALLNLIAVFPLFALPFLLGGVTLKSYGLLLVALLAVLALSLSFGLLCSVMFRDDRTSLGAAVLLMVVSLGGPPLALAVLHELNVVSTDSVEKLVGLSTGAPIVVALSGQSTNPEAWHAFVLSGFTTGAEILISLVLAAVALPVVFKREAMGGGPAKKGSAATRLPNTDPTESFRLNTPRRDLLDVNPVVWLCQRGRFQRAMPWLALGALAVLWLGGLMIWKRAWLDAGICLFTAFVLHTTLKFLVASSACRQFNQDRNSGAIELLLCTSMTVPEILRGQWLAVTRQFRGPLAAVLVVDLLLYLKFMGNMTSSDEITTTTLVWIAGVVALLTDLVAMVTLSMWLGLTNRRANAAVTKTVTRVMGIPWAVFVVGMSLTSILPFSFRGNLSAVAIILFWLALSVGNAIAWFVYASGRLRMGFRTQAIGQHKDGAGILARLFSGFRQTPPPLPGGSR
jgi:hypothetical protein